MNKYIALLRGINVGGHRKILMAELKAMFIKEGFSNPVSYIQSGNVIFESKIANVSELENTISTAIYDQFGFDVPVLIKTSTYFKDVIETDIYKKSDENVKFIYFTFLSKTPSKSDVVAFNQLEFGNDKFKILGQTIHVLFAVPSHKSKLTNKLIENKLNCKATTRNWKTVNKLNILSQ